jgi:CRP-like cAMP-binding protein
MSIALLEGLSPEDAARAAEHLRAGSTEYGVVLMEEGEDDQSLAWVARGKVSVHVGDIELGTADPGETVGEGALFSSWVRAYTSRAVSPCEFVIVDRAGYEALRAARNPVTWRLEQAALATTVRWVRALDEKIADLAPGRVLHFERAGWAARVSEWLGGTAGRPVGLDAAQVLQGTPHFADADAGALSDIAGSMQAVRWPADYAVIVEGSAADRVHLLVDGEARVIRHTRKGHGEVVAKLEPGAVFGMGAVVRGDGHGASVVTHGSATTLSMDAPTWEVLSRSEDAIGSALRLAAIRALTDAFAGGRAHLLRLHERRRREIHAMIEPLYEVGTPSEVSPPRREEGPALHIVY